jgi:hypothetical protein
MAEVSYKPNYIQLMFQNARSEHGVGLIPSINIS